MNSSKSFRNKIGIFISYTYYVIKAYGPTVFNIVMNPQLIHGSHHFLEYLKMARNCLSNELFDFVSYYFWFNSYFAHPESIMLCGLLSKFSSPQVKEKSKQLILKSRATKRRSRARKVRRFKRPTEKQFNKNANNDILELIHWPEYRNCEITPPPYLDDLIDAEIKKDVEKNLKEKIPSIYCVLCHSQHNERNICYTTASVCKNAGEEKQKSAIIINETSCNEFPHGMSKTDSKTKLKFD